MRLITRSELSTRSDSDLSDMFREASQELARSKPASPERRNALATLENVSCERAARRKPNRPR